MGILRVRLFGDPVLRQEAFPVTDFNESLHQLAHDMIDTMNAYNGVGLAAPQVGVLKRLFTYLEPELEESLVAVNPVIDWTSEEVEEAEEGCLSLPGLFYPTKRPLELHMSAKTELGEDFTVEAQGLLARIIAHEHDHLNGIMFLDHLARHDKKAAFKRIRAGELEENETFPTADDLVE